MKIHRHERAQAAPTSARATVDTDQKPSAFEQAYRSRQTVGSGSTTSMSNAAHKKRKDAERKDAERNDTATVSGAPQPLPIRPPIEVEADPSPVAAQIRADAATRAVGNIEQLAVTTRARTDAEAANPSDALSEAIPETPSPAVSTLSDFAKPGVFDQVVAQIEPVVADEHPDLQVSRSVDAAAPVAVPHETTAKHWPLATQPMDQTQEQTPAVASRAVEHPDLLMDLIAQHLSPKAAQDSDSDDRAGRVEDSDRTEKSSLQTAAPMQLLASDAPAPVEAAKEVRDVDWHGMAEKILDVGGGSIEGHRARLVLGSGDDRVVMTISTHAHRVSVEVEQNTPAGAAMAEALQKGQHELREALGRRGLDLSQNDARNPAQHGEAAEARERRNVVAPKPKSEESSTPRDSKRVVVMA